GELPDADAAGARVAAVPVPRSRPPAGAAPAALAAQARPRPVRRPPRRLVGTRPRVLRGARGRNRALVAGGVSAEARDTIALGGGALELLDIPGREPSLLLMHEGLGSVGLWRSFPYELAEATGRRVVAFSRFGHGASDPPPNARTPSFMHE